MAIRAGIDWRNVRVCFVCRQEVEWHFQFFGLEERPVVCEACLFERLTGVRLEPKP